ncbi:MAG: DNA alkylation repair protein [Planctomycetes bacterium]|nr:DNA alkylation repair protein [Planctomycetota bacterium]
MAWLEKRGTKKQIGELARYGITANRPFGVTVADLRRYAKQIGTDHTLALELWSTERYEARMLATMVADPARMTVRTMNDWVRGFDNWAIVDTACFSCFDRAPGAWGRVGPWSRAKPEFQKRAAFALLWSLSTHDREASDRAFIEGLRVIEQGSTDGRNFVKKAVDMALRAIGKRNTALNRAATATAERLAASTDPTARWVGNHALRELRSPGVRERLGRKKSR